MVNTREWRDRQDWQAERMSRRRNLDSSGKKEGEREGDAQGPPARQLPVSQAWKKQAKCNIQRERKVNSHEAKSK